MRTMMITGDYHHTAIAVARDVGMVRPQGQVVVIETAAQPRLRSENSVMSSQVGSRASTPVMSPRASAFKHRDFPVLQAEAANHAEGQPKCTLPPLKLPHWARAAAPNEAQQHPTLPHLKIPGIRKQVSWVGLPDEEEQEVQDVLHAPVSEVSPARGKSLGRLQIPADAFYAPSSARNDFSPGDFQLPSSFTASPRVMLEGLRFTSGPDTLQPCQALSALAEGRMQCAVTGDAFQYMLQQPELSTLEAVMRNVIVFSRMQPHQKGQVVDLLSIRGIHQLFHGQPRHIAVRSSHQPRPYIIQCINKDVNKNMLLLVDIIYY